MKTQTSVVQAARRIVVKVGPSLVTNEGRGLDQAAIAAWADQITRLRHHGRQVVLVSSGAVAEGMQRLGWKKRPTVVNELQAAAAVFAEVDEAGRAIGMIHEYDLLNFLIEGKHRLSEMVEPLVQPLQGVVALDTPISRLRAIFNDDNVAVVKEGEKVTGILTKIDLIEFLGERMK